jgi:tight adherence protein B
LLALAGVFAERAVRGGRIERIGSIEAAVRRSPFPWKRLWPLALLAVLITAGPAAAVVVGAVTLAGLRLRARRRRSLEERRREEQLADVVAAIAAGLRAGLSLTQSLEHARDETPPPLHDDLARTIARIDTGVPIGEALAGWADNVASEDAHLVVGVLELHRRSGGDLPSVLDNLVATLRDRRATHREVRALTAQARLSAVILGMLPIGFFGFLLLTSRHEILEAIATPLGEAAVAIGLGLEGLASLWIRRLLEVG